MAVFYFQDSKPRSFLNIIACAECLAPNDVAGLLVSVAAQKTPKLIPGIIFETDKTIVFKRPRPRYRIHYIFLPKKNIKNIGELTGEDNESIIDLLSTIVTVINKLETKKYRLWTNGPGKQDVPYLHFHLVAE